MVLLGVARRVAAEGQFSNAKRSLRKDSGSASGVAKRLLVWTCSSSVRRKYGSGSWEEFR